MAADHPVRPAGRPRRSPDRCRPEPAAGTASAHASGSLALRGRALGRAARTRPLGRSLAASTSTGWPADGAAPFPRAISVPHGPDLWPQVPIYDLTRKHYLWAATGRSTASAPVRPDRARGRLRDRPQPDPDREALSRHRSPGRRRGSTDAGGRGAGARRHGLPAGSVWRAASPRPWTRASCSGSPGRSTIS